MSQRTLIALVLAVLLVSGAIYMMLTLNTGQPPQQAAETDLAEVVVAAQKIPAYEQVSSRMIRVEKRPKEYLPPGAVTEVARVEGFYVDRDILPGQVIFETFVKSEGNPLMNKLNKDENERAFTVSVNEASGLSGLIEPGAHVDVVSVLQLGHGQAISKIILQNVRVLAVGSQVTTTDEEEGARRYRTVTLALTPDQVEAINMVTTQGRGISLALRARDDLKKVETQGMTLKDVVNPRSLSGAKEDSVLLASIFGLASKKSPRSSRDQELVKTVASMKAEIEALKAGNRGRAGTAVPAAAQHQPWRIEVFKGTSMREELFESKDSDERFYPGTRARPVRTRLPAAAESAETNEEPGARKK